MAPTNGADPAPLRVSAASGRLTTLAHVEKEGAAAGVGWEVGQALRDATDAGRAPAARRGQEVPRNYMVAQQPLPPPPLPPLDLREPGVR